MGDDAVGHAVPPTHRWQPWCALAEKSLRRRSAGLLHLSGPHPQRRRRPARPVEGGRARASSRPCAAALSDHPGTTLELIVPGCLNGFSDDEVDLMATLSLLANRPANWNVLGVSALNPAACDHQLEASTTAAERGATVVALTLPHTMKIRLSFEHGAVIDGLPGWREVFALPIPERMQRLADPMVRKRPRPGGPLRGGRASSPPSPTGRT